MLDRLPNYIKPVVFLSVLIGLVFGVLLVIPIVQMFMFLAFWIVGGVIAFLLKRNSFIGQFGQKEGIIIGSVSGMVSVVAAAVSFVPLSMIIGVIASTISVGFFFSSFFSLFVFVMLVFFIGLMNIIFNIGSALLVISLMNGFEQDKLEKQEFKVEL